MVLTFSLFRYILQNMELIDYQTKNNLSNRELAKMIDCHESFICHYNKGRKHFSPQKAQKIAKRLKGVTVMEILFPKKTGQGAQQ
jgi:ribosome-binding protein aMBF1 (putative translation factor)